MAAKFRVYDAGGGLVFDESMLLTKYLTSVTFAWNDFSTKTVTHDGLTGGTPFYHVVNHNRQLPPNKLLRWEYLGTGTYIECSFSGNVATVKQINAGRGIVGTESVVVHIGVFG